MQLKIMVIFKYVSFKSQEIHSDIIKANTWKVMPTAGSCESKNMTHNQCDNYILSRFTKHL